MPDNIEPLKFYQEPLYYTGLLTLISIALATLNNFSPNLRIILIVFALIFGALTFFMWDTKCPNCKRPFAKVEENGKKEKINERIETKIHYDKVKYLYSDGHVLKIEKGKAHEIPHRISIYRQHYHCKKCKHVWSNDREVDLDKHIFKPNVTTIQTNEKNPLQALVENSQRPYKDFNKTYDANKSQSNLENNKAKVKERLKYEINNEQKLGKNMGYKMCPHCWKKMKKERVNKLMSGKWSYQWVCNNRSCPRYNPIRLRIK